MILLSWAHLAHLISMILVICIGFNMVSGLCLILASFVLVGLSCCIISIVASFLFYMTIWVFTAVCLCCF